MDDEPEQSPLEALQSYFALMIRVAYRTGFTDGHNWRSDEQHVESQVRAFDFEELHRASTNEAIKALHTGAEYEEK